MDSFFEDPYRGAFGGALQSQSQEADGRLNASSWRVSRRSWADGEEGGGMWSSMSPGGGFPSSQGAEKGGRDSNSSSATSNSQSGSSVNSFGCVPVTVALLLKALTEEQKQLMIHGKVVGQVTLCGWVSDLSILASQARFHLSDGSGSVDVSFGFEDARRFAGGGLGGAKADEEEKENHGGSVDDNLGDEAMHRNTEDGSQGEKGKTKGAPGDWRARCLKDGALVRIVGVGVREKNGECFIEASFVRAIEDVREYLEFHDVEVCFAALKLLGSAALTGQVEKRLTAELKDVAIKEENGGFFEASEVEKWMSKPLPKDLSHINDKRQIVVVKGLLYGCQDARARDGILQKKLAPLLSPDAFKEALKELALSGDVVHVNGLVEVVREDEGDI